MRAKERWTALSLNLRRPRWWIRSGVIACVALALILAAITRADAPNPYNEALTGKPGPQFALPIAQNGQITASPARIGGPRPHAALIVFFNTLCVHCQSEIEAADVAASSAALDIVYIDTPAESAQIVDAYMGRLGLDPPVLMDPGGAAARAYSASYAPTTILIDQRGEIRGVWVGETGAQALIAGVNRALGS